MSGDQSEKSENGAEGPVRGGEDVEEYNDPVEEESVKGYRCRACGAIFSSHKELETHWNKAHASWRRKRRRR